MYENLLPVGSVVLLKGANKRVVVIGRLQTRAGDRKVYHYCACTFPEGLMDLDSFVFFDHDDIDRVYFVGCQDSEELRFREEQLAPLGELYVNDDGEVVQREKPE